MKEMIKEVRERREGFTMAELLIVVAIIAVLVAIAIPVFTSQLGKSEAATDAASIRSGYAEATAAVLTTPPTEDTVYYLAADCSVSTTTPTTAYACKGESSKLGTGTIIGSQEVNATGGLTWAKGATVSYEWDVDDQKMTITLTAKKTTQTT